jgi:hypothetical protein
MKQALQQCVDSDEEKEESIIDHKIWSYNVELFLLIYNVILRINLHKNVTASNSH